MLPFLAHTQDARFAQMAASPQLINPAMTGMMAGELRFTANYRALYGSILDSEGYRSIGAGIELRRPAGNGNFFGIGAQLQRDEAGSSEFIRSQGLIGVSYQQHIGGSRRRGVAHYLSGGAQLGVGQRGFDFNKLWFSQQYFVDNTTREAFLDQSRASGELYGGRGAGTYLDVNAGLGYFGSFGERMGAYFGVGVFHLTQPNVSPLPGLTDQLDQRFVIHGGGELPLGRGDMSFLPAARIMLQGPAYEALFGSNVRYTEGRWKEVALRAGLWGQISNQTGDSPGFTAWIVSVGLETERLQFGVSYDLAVGDLNTVANSRGGWEISMIYVLPASYRQKVICPKF